MRAASVAAAVSAASAAIAAVAAAYVAWMANRNRRGSQRPDCVADDAVWLRTSLSKAKFPDNREKYRENRKFGLQMTMASLANAATMRVLSEIRYRN
jgi:Flp pilus assembly protein TadB